MKNQNYILDLQKMSMKDSSSDSNTSNFSMFCKKESSISAFACVKK